VGGEEADEKGEEEEGEGGEAVKEAAAVRHLAASSSPLYNSFFLYTQKLAF
jgi:hypothetical protein